MIRKSFKFKLIENKKEADFFNKNIGSSDFK